MNYFRYIVFERIVDYLNEIFMDGWIFVLSVIGWMGLVGVVCLYIEVWVSRLGDFFFG